MLHRLYQEIEEVKIWFDPTRRQPIDGAKPLDTSALSGWLREWYAKGRATDLRGPLPQTQLAPLLDRIDAQLPSDYLDFVTQTDGARLASCVVVHGLTGIREIVWPNENYYVIAEKTGHALAVKRGDRTGALYLINNEDDEARPYGKSLEKAVSDLLEPR